MNIFVSYSHRNSDWVSETGKYPLIPWLKEQLVGQAEIWTDHALKQMLGEDYTKLIRSKIKEADIAILLISQEFAKPGYIHDVEIPLMKERYLRGELKIIPLLISKLSGKGKDNLSWIFDLQTYPNDTKPLLSFVNDDSIWAEIRVDILDGIETKIDQIKEANIAKKTIKQNSISKSNQEINLSNENIKSNPVYSTNIENQPFKEHHKNNVKTSGNIWGKRYWAFIGLIISFVFVGYLMIDRFLLSKDSVVDNTTVLLNETNYNKKSTNEKSSKEGVTNSEADFKRYFKAAEKGDASAMYNVGVLYNHGNGVDRDYKKAMKWYLKAADKGHAFAMFNIGMLFINGQGVDKDYKIAMGWFLKAAERGDISAMYNIGIHYSRGHGVDQDYKKAMEWFLRAAEKGHAKAMNKVGMLYKNGRGVQPNEQEAELWFEKARKSGYKD